MRNAATASHALQRAATLATEHGWCVVVCPTGGDIVRLLRAVLPLVLPGTEVCGRTALLGVAPTLNHRARLSIVEVNEPVFVPEGVPYAVLLTGWGDDLVSSPSDLAAWQARAAHTESS